jgi:hypothetical protein
MIKKQSLKVGLKQFKSSTFSGNRCLLSLAVSRRWNSTASSTTPSPATMIPTDSITETETLLKTRSYQEIVADMTARKNKFIEIINTDDVDTSDWKIASGSLTDQHMYLSTLTEGDLVETNTGNVGVILKVPDFISFFLYSIVDHQGSVSEVPANSIAFRIPKFVTAQGKLSDTIRVLDDSDPARPVVSTTQKTREFLCPNIKQFVQSSERISEMVSKELENIFSELQESGEPVNLSLFEVAWYVEQNSRNRRIEASDVIKQSSTARYPSLKGLFPPKSVDASKKRTVNNETLFAIFTSLRTKFSDKVLFDKNEKYIPTILTLIPFSLENEHHRALAMARNVLSHNQDRLIVKINSMLKDGYNNERIKSIMASLGKGELEIINIIKRYAVGDLNDSDYSSLALASMFLKKLDKYKNIKITSSIAFQFLQDIGVFQKWDNPVRFQSKLLSLEVSTKKAVYMAERTELPDRVEKLREDFDLPVYCIDAADAHEIDDGISVSNTDQRIWKVTIHIADPSSSVSLTDPLIKHAYRQTSTAYYPENVIPLFPTWFTESLGLVSDGEPRRCLSFEFNFDSITKTFDIDGMKVIPRMAKKVVQITYDTVDQIIKAQDYADKAVLKDIQNMHIVAKAFSEHRFKKGAIGLTIDKPIASLENYAGDSSNFKINVEIPKMSKARDLVAEFMILCNHGTAQYLKDRKVANIYRTQSIFLSSQAARDEFNKVVRRQQPKIDGIGKTLTIKDSLSLLPRVRAAGLSVDPQPHAALGLDLYTQTTSPLRRFQDILCHWQLESFLLNEQSSMFDTSQMDSMAVRLMRNQGLLKRASTHSHFFWALRKIEQSLAENPEGDVVQCIITSNAMSTTYSAYCVNWGIFVKIESNVGDAPLTLGQTIDCKCVEIDCPQLSITLARV